MGVVGEVSIGCGEVVKLGVGAMWPSQWPHTSWYCIDWGEFPEYTCWLWHRPFVTSNFVWLDLWKGTYSHRLVLKYITIPWVSLMISGIIPARIMLTLSGFRWYLKLRGEEVCHILWLLACSSYLMKILICHWEVVWWTLVGSGWLRRMAMSHGWGWLMMHDCGWLLMAVDGWGSDVCGWLWMAKLGWAWLRMVEDGWAWPKMVEVDSR